MSSTSTRQEKINAVIKRQEKINVVIKRQEKINVVIFGKKDSGRFTLAAALHSGKFVDYKNEKWSRPSLFKHYQSVDAKQKLFIRIADNYNPNRPINLSAHLIILTVDLSKSDSDVKKDVKELIKLIKHYFNVKKQASIPPIILVGTKSDLSTENKVNLGEIKKKHGFADCVATSAKTSPNMGELEMKINKLAKEGGEAYRKRRQCEQKAEIYKIFSNKLKKYQQSPEFKQFGNKKLISRLAQLKNLEQVKNFVEQYPLTIATSLYQQASQEYTKNNSKNIHLRPVLRK